MTTWRQALRAGVLLAVVPLSLLSLGGCKTYERRSVQSALPAGVSAYRDRLAKLDERLRSLQLSEPPTQVLRRDRDR